MTAFVCNGTVVVQNKSSLILMIIFTNAQTLQLFTINIEAGIICKSSKQQGLGWEILNLSIKSAECNGLRVRGKVTN
jgi:hypothetical protein